MKHTRFALLLVSGLSSIVACGGSDDTPSDTSAAGSAGSAGQGGSTAGAAGKADSGGAGQGGKSGGGAGQGGQGGKSSGGAGQGGAGAAGQPGGAAGSAGALAGAAGSAGDSAGAAGIAGAAGTAGNASAGTAGTAGAGGDAGGAGAGGDAGAGGSPDSKAEVLAKLAFPCNDTIDDIYKDSPPPSPWDATHRGDVARCAYDRLVPLGELKQHYADNNLPVPALTTDVHKIRISFWTERDVLIPPPPSGPMSPPPSGGGGDTGGAAGAGNGGASGAGASGAGTGGAGTGGAGGAGAGGMGAGSAGDGAGGVGAGGAGAGGAGAGGVGAGGAGIGGAGGVGISGAGGAGTGGMGAGAGAGGATGSSEPRPVLTSAVLYVPVTRKAEVSPLIVYGHGTVGAADLCAPSRDDPGGFQIDWRSAVYHLIGQGWLTIMPDYPGLGTAGTPAWQDSEDAGHSLLDATRAARKLTVPGFVGDRNAFLGHSEGGHAVLAAHSYAASYGFGGASADAFVAFAPVSFSQASWGAILAPFAKGLGDFTPGALAFSTEYIYGHLAKYAGEDHRKDAFQTTPAPPGMPGTMADTIENIMETRCLQDLGTSLMALTPKMVSSDLYTIAYTNDVGNCGVFGVCKTPNTQWWRSLWVADRPSPDKTLPLVIWQGGADESVSPGLQQCGIDRLVDQGAKPTLCGDAQATHGSAGGIVTSETAWGWIEPYLAARLLDGPEPGACPPITDKLGATPKCSTPPPNSTSPTDP